MEEKHESMTNISNLKPPFPMDLEAKTKKKIGGIKLLRALIQRSGGKSKSNKEKVVSNGMWKRLLCAMRPLHVQSNQFPRKRIEVPLPPAVVERFEDVMAPPLSPSVSSEAGSSRYASVDNLQALDCTASNDEDGNGDEMIDAKAEEFIANFYKQMRQQELDSVNRQYDERLQRSIA